MIWDLKHVYIEPQQAVADGHFPTAPYPNPENPDAWELALKLAKEKDADLVLATDPDADRLGVYCKDTRSGEYVTFTGNMSGNADCGIYSEDRNVQIIQCRRIRYW